MEFPHGYDIYQRISWCGLMVDTLDLLKLSNQQVLGSIPVSSNYQCKLTSHKYRSVHIQVKSLYVSYITVKCCCFSVLTFIYNRSKHTTDCIQYKHICDDMTHVG